MREAGGVVTHLVHPWVVGGHQELSPNTLVWRLATWFREKVTATVAWGPIDLSSVPKTLAICSSFYPWYLTPGQLWGIGRAEMLAFGT